MGEVLHRASTGTRSAFRPIDPVHSNGLGPFRRCMHPVDPTVGDVMSLKALGHAYRSEPDPRRIQNGPRLNRRRVDGRKLVLDPQRRLGKVSGLNVATVINQEAVEYRLRGWNAGKLSQRVGSGGGAVLVGSGAYIPLAFAAVLSPAPIGPFPPPALRTGRADFPHPALQRDHASRTRNAGSGSHSRCRWRACPPASRSCTASPARCPSPSRRRA